MNTEHKVVDLVPAWAVHQNHGELGGFYIRSFGPVAKGHVERGHLHYIDHLTFVESGAVAVKWRSQDGKRSGEIKRIEAPNFVEVKADAWHEVTALEDGTRYRCLFAAAEARALAEGPTDPILISYMGARR